MNLPLTHIIALMTTITNHYHQPPPSKFPTIWHRYQEPAAPPTPSLTNPQSIPPAMPTDTYQPHVFSTHSFLDYLEIYNPLPLPLKDYYRDANLPPLPTSKEDALNNYFELPNYSLKHLKPYVLNGIKDKLLNDYRKALYLIFGNEIDLMPTETVLERSCDDMPSSRTLSVEPVPFGLYEPHSYITVKHYPSVDVLQFTFLLDELLSIKHCFNFNITDYTTAEWDTTFSELQSYIPLISDSSISSSPKSVFSQLVNFYSYTRRSNFSFSSLTTSTTLSSLTTRLIPILITYYSSNTYTYHSIIYCTSIYQLYKLYTIY